MDYQNPRNFHHAKPMVNQITRLTVDTMNPTRHQSANVTTDDGTEVEHHASALRFGSDLSE
jgi:hypothetical protein